MALPAISHHDVRRIDVPMRHPPPVHLRHRPPQRPGQSDQLDRIQRSSPLGQRHTADIGQQDRVRGRRQPGRQLRDSLDTGQLTEDLHLMPLPPPRAGPQQLLADHASARERQPNDPGPLRLMEHRHPRSQQRIPARHRCPLVHLPAPHHATPSSSRVPGLCPGSAQTTPLAMGRTRHTCADVALRASAPRGRSRPRPRRQPAPSGRTGRRPGRRPGAPGRGGLPGCSRA